MEELGRARTCSEEGKQDTWLKGKDAGLSKMLMEDVKRSRKMLGCQRDT